MCKLTRLESIKRIQFAVVFFLVIKTKSFHSLGFNNEKVYQNYASYQNDQNVPKNDDWILFILDMLDIRKGFHSLYPVAFAVYCVL